MVIKKARCAGKSPWLIFTNTTEFSPKQIRKLYCRRMQIEQNFRYEKNTRCGFGLRHSMVHSPERIRVPRLIATLESIIMCLSRYLFEKKMYLKYQTNTVRHRRLVSLLTLAENVFRHSPQILKSVSLDKALQKLHRRYSNMVLIY
ncbi:MAG: transposase [Serratia symbiotica]|nr:transposase [Serratia symbiotica]